MSRLYAMIGSSGSGKTTLLRRVVAERLPRLNVIHVDDPGAAKTAASWVERAVKATPTVRLLVAEGQERPHVILDAAKRSMIPARVVLIDCDHTERRRRLVEIRKQPELDHLDMYAWAAYLRGEADALGLEIIDTTNKSIEVCTELLADSIERYWT